jgi:hypothetical protein
VAAPAAHRARLALVVARSDRPSPESAEEAARALSDALRDRKLAESLTAEDDEYGPRVLAEGLARAAAHAGPAGRAACSEAARLLAGAMEKEANALYLGELAVGLAAVAGVIQPDEAERLCSAAARDLANAYRGGNFNDRLFLGSGLAALAARMRPSDALGALDEALDGVEPFGHARLAEALPAVLARMEPPDAARLAGESLTRERRAEHRRRWATALSATAGRMDPREAHEACASAAQVLAGDLAAAPCYSLPRRRSTTQQPLT